MEGVRWMARNEWRVAGWAASLALSLLLIATSVRVAAGSLPLYEALFERHGVSERTGITPEGLADVGRQIQAYFDGEEEPLQATAVVRGVERELFTAEEVSHMADVKQLFLRTRRAQGGAALLLAALTVAAFWRFRGGAYATLAQWMRRAAVATAGFVLIVGFLSVVAFDAVFTMFHYLGFPQGNWAFDPRTSYLVQVFPQGFWFDATLTVGLLSLLGAGALWAVGFAVPALLGRGVRARGRSAEEGEG